MDLAEKDIPLSSDRGFPLAGRSLSTPRRPSTTTTSAALKKKNPGKTSFMTHREIRVGVQGAQEQEDHPGLGPPLEDLPLRRKGRPHRRGRQVLAARGIRCRGHAEGHREGHQAGQAQVRREHHQPAARQEPLPLPVEKPLAEGQGSDPHLAASRTTSRSGASWRST